MKQTTKDDIRAFSIGASGYPLIEILYRGSSHWTMSITGGLCFLFFHRFNRKHFNTKWWKKCFVGTFIITSMELVVGLIVNRLLGMKVWDYSDQPHNFMGQICLLYSTFWFLLSIPLCGISKLLLSCSRKKRA